MDAHCGRCACEGLLPRDDVSPRGGRGSTGIRVPCRLPRVRVLRAALLWRSGVVHSAGVVAVLLLYAAAVLFVVGALVFLVG